MKEIFKECNEKEMMEVEGGRFDAVDFAVSYVVGKAVDFVVNNFSGICDAIKTGPSKDDPMYNTSYVKIFGH